MAYLLDFPSTTLSDDIRAPPYVIFAINGTSIRDKLPHFIPFKVVLHFAPKLADFKLPLPQNLPPKVAQGVLATPFVGIDIRLDIGLASVQRIIFQIMQSAGFIVPQHLLQHQPSLITSISIHRTWTLFELPAAGLDGLHIHMQTTLMTVPPVTFSEIQELWAIFPATHIILRLAANNFVESHIALFYSRDEFSAIRHWYLKTKERYAVFKAVEDQFPEFESSRKAKEAKAREEFEKRNVVKRQSSKEVSRRKAETMIRKSLKWRSAEGLRVNKVTLDDMSVKLSEALRKVQIEREAEVEIEEGERKDELKDIEYLQPEAYKPILETK